MYNYFSKATALVGLVAIGLTACKKDETRATMKDGVAPVLAASATTTTLTSTTGANNAVTYNWSAADFGYQAATSYTLQFAKKGDNFKTTQDISLGNALTKTLTGKELNGIYNGLDCNISSTPSATPLDVRVKAVIGDAVAPVYSNLVGITTTPFQAQTPPADSWGIIGAATPTGWNSDTPMSYDFCNRTYKITIQLTKDEFKFRANGGWAVNLGDDGADGKLEANGANIVSPGAGLYDVTLDMTATPKPTYTIKLH
ncbi:SusE domain-containing protein [Hymenobacter sp. DH14]|uniref:SusE domain-containing protein n=1 Tax=Hymenobacter cyanobacteriorum TaxID=2926463 RepID=A0A9X2AEI1_9BACT|nr:SusE domain-containing protein [Hymenobacter cyanobacteriorum]MCI1187251.1 SusE domain-containing protein [Hymenobacter cyanobacteriorum]